MSQPTISKDALINILQSWRQGQISAEQLQDWMVLNYDPDEVAIGVGECPWTIEAMNIVMNEYEIVQTEKVVIEKVGLAIDFINATEASFDEAKARFIRQAFVD